MVQAILLGLVAIFVKRTQLILNTAFSDYLAWTSVCAGMPSLQSDSKYSLFLVCYIILKQNYVDALTWQIMFYLENK